MTRLRVKHFEEGGAERHSSNGQNSSPKKSHAYSDRPPILVLCCIYSESTQAGHLKKVFCAATSWLGEPCSGACSPKLCRPCSGALYTVCLYGRSGACSVYAVYTVNSYTMRICVTCPSDCEEINAIWQYCQDNDIVMCTGPYVYVKDSYWVWRIDCELTPAVTWLLLKWDQYLTVY